MNRRTVLGALTGALLAAPLAAGAQRVGSVPTVGVLTPGWLRARSPGRATRLLSAAFMSTAGSRGRVFVSSTAMPMESRDA